MNGGSCASVMRFTTGHDGGREGSTQVVGRGPKCWFSRGQGLRPCRRGLGGTRVSSPSPGPPWPVLSWGLCAGSVEAEPRAEYGERQKQQCTQKQTGVGCGVGVLE